jgi:hypothetical protein
VLAATRKQDDQGASASREVHAIPRSSVDPQFRHTLADWRDVSRIPGGQPFEPSLNPRSAPEVAQIVEPSRKAVCLAQLDHCSTVAVWLRSVNHPQIERPAGERRDSACEVAADSRVDAGEAGQEAAKTAIAPSVLMIGLADRPPARTGSTTL